MADGRVVIEIDADSSKFSAAVGKLGDTAKQSLGTAIKGSFIGNLFANAFSKAAGVISSSLDGAISRVDTLNQFPRVMSQLGYGADSASAAIGKMSVPKFKDVGKATDVMLAFNDALVAGGQSSQVQEAALEQYVQGISKGKFELEEWRSIQTAMPGQLDAVAQSMLGAGKSSNDLYEALKSGKVSVDDFADAFVKLDSEGINGMASFAEQAKTGSAGIATSMSNAANAVTVQIAKIIDKINENGEIAAGFDAIKQAVTEFGGAAVTAVGWVKDNFGTIAPIVAAVGAAFTALQIVPAIMPAVGAVQSLVSVVRSVGAASVAIKVLGSAVAAVGGPVTIVIAAIAALVAVFATLYATNQDFANAVNGAWAQIQAAFTAIQPSLQALGEQFMALGEAIMPALTQIGTLILDLATTLISALAPVIQQIVEAVTAAMPTITAAIQFVANVLAVIIGVVVQVVSAFVSFGQTLVSAAQSAADFVSNVGSFLSGLPGVIWGFLTGALSNVANFVGQMASNAASAGQQFLSNIGGALGGLAGRVGGFLGSAIGQAASFVGQMASKASQAGQQFMSNIVSTLSGIPGRVASIGGQIVSGIANGIRGAAGAVVSALGGVVNQAVEHAKSMLGIHSPSRVMRNLIGKNIPRGVAVGIEDETATAVSAVRAMSAQVVDAGNASMEIPPIEVQKAVAVMDSTTQESVFGDSFMQGVQAITERLDLIYAKLDEIKQAIQEDREVRIDKREFARLVREV